MTLIRPFTIIFLLAICTADGISTSTATLQNHNSTEYNLSILTKASAPCEITLTRIDPERDNATVIEHGTLFTTASRTAKRVEIAGDFSKWKTIPMKKGENGVWYYFLPNTDDEKLIRYKFMVDGVWCYDTSNPDMSNDGYGSFVSNIHTERNKNFDRSTYKILRDGTIEFRIYIPSASYVALAGDFNNWDPEQDILSRGDDNVWRIKKHLPKGSFRYKYYIDGTWKVDTYNPASASDETGEVCSLIKIK